jgi:putative FmdB family regulatory protein
MPLHRHECEACGNRFRVLVLRGAENETPTCPVCGSASTRRLMPLVAVQFKGSGYYKTDYKRGDRGRSSQGTATESADPAEPKPSGESKPSGDSEPPNGATKPPKAPPAE